MSLERDNSETLHLPDLEFVLTPSSNNNLEAFFEQIASEIFRISPKTSVQASLPDLSALPPLNFQAPLLHWEQIQYFCRSASFRTQAALQEHKLPINLSSDNFVAIGALIGACKTIDKNRIALIYLDSGLKLNNTPAASESFMAILTQKKPEYESFLAGINYETLETPFLKKEQIFQIGFSEPSFIKPDFYYYSIDILQEYGLNQVLSELEKNLENFEQVYIHWNTSVIKEYGLNYREALQIANWIDFKIRRQNKLLGLNIIDESKPALAKQAILRIMGDLMICPNYPK